MKKYTEDNYTLQVNLNPPNLIIEGVGEFDAMEKKFTLQKGISADKATKNFFKNLDWGFREMLEKTALSARTELIKEIRDKMPKKSPYGHHDARNYFDKNEGYDSCLSEFESIINKLTKQNENTTNDRNADRRKEKA